MSTVSKERKRVILSLLAEDNRLGVSDLSKRFGVTMVTTRADLTALEEEGMLLRTHGGAMPAFHPKIMDRMRSGRDVKRLIAKAAANLINDGDNVIIGEGTTTALIAKYLLGKKDIHIVTNNTLFVTYARNNPQLRVTLIGGEFRSSEEGLVGSMALQAIGQFSVAKAFIGVTGICQKQGFNANTIEGAELVRKMADQADEVIVVVDSSKCGVAGFARILPFNKVDALVTDSGLQSEFEANLLDAGVKITKA
jgi:DeoR family galactitol utilization operon repressor